MVKSNSKQGKYQFWQIHIPCSFIPAILCWFIPKSLFWYLPNSLFGYTMKNFVTKTELHVGLYWENFKIFKKNQIHAAWSIIFWYNKILRCFVTENCFHITGLIFFWYNQFPCWFTQGKNGFGKTKIPSRLIPGKSCFGISKFHVGLYQEE